MPVAGSTLPYRSRQCEQLRVDIRMGERQGADGHIPVARGPGEGETCWLYERQPEAGSTGVDIGS